MLTPTERTTKINECKKSGLSVREWCEQNGINHNTYYGWIKKAKKKQINQSQSDFGWVELSVPKPKIETIKEMHNTGQPEKRILISNGKWKISIPEGITGPELVRTLRAVSRA